jgi:NTE family protein
MDTPLGLALGGGGTRGIAHLGVLRVLEAEGIRPTLLTGTSSGSLVAAAYAAGVPLAEIERLAHKLRWQQLAEVAFTRRGVLEAGRLRAMVDHLVGGRTIEQLSVPLGVVTTDLITGRTYVIRTGKVADAVRASCGVPGVFQPVRWDGHLLVDGGVTENCPARAAREMGADPVIGVELNGWDATVPEPRHALRVALRSLDIMQRAIAERDAMYADVIIRPRLANISNIDFSKAALLIKRGEEAARAVLPAIRAVIVARRGTPAAPVATGVTGEAAAAKGVAAP